MATRRGRRRIGVLDATLVTLGLAALGVIVARSRETPAADPPGARAAPTRPAGLPPSVPRAPLPGTPSPLAQAEPPAPQPEDLTPVACPIDTRTPSGPPPRAQVSSSWYQGAIDFDSAMREHERTGAPLVLYFFTDWCGYCREVERELLTSGTFASYVERSAVKLRVNPETGSDARTLADRFGVRGYPAFIVKTELGGVERLALYAGEHLRTPDRLIAAIETRLVDDARDARSRATSLLAARKPAEAAAVLTHALAVAPSPREFILRAVAYAADGALENALDDLAYATQQSRDPSPYELSARMLAARSRWDEAIGCWSAFLGLQPTEARAYLGRAEALEARGLPVRAAADRKRACELGESRACAATGAGLP